MFTKSRKEIKTKSQSFKKEILGEFLKTKKNQIEKERDEAWNKFFDEVESFRKSKKGQEAIRKIKDKVEKFSEDFHTLKDEVEIVDEFGTRMKKIYFTWRAFFKKTFLFFFVFVIFSGVSVFVMSIPLADYIGYWMEYLGLIFMIIGLILFLIWARYSFGSIRYHFYGEIDDFLLASSNEVEKRLDEYFDKFVKRWRRTQMLFKDVLLKLLREYPMLSTSYEMIATLRKAIRILRK